MRYGRLRCLVLLGSLAFTGTAAAQSTMAAGFQLNRYEPTAAGEWSFAVDHPWYSATRYLAAGLTLDYAHDPLVFGLRAANGDFTKQVDVIQHDLLLHLDVAFSLFNRFTLSLTLPVTLTEAGNTVDGVGPLSGPAVGDFRVGLMGRIFGQPETDVFSLNLGLDVWIPFGLQDKLTGDSNVRARPKLVMAGVTNHLRWSFSGAFYYRGQAYLGPSTELAGNQVGPSWEFGAALAYADRVRRFSVGPELLLSTVLTDGHAYSKDFTSLDILLGGWYNIAGYVNTGLAAGIGTLREPGTPDFRLLFRLAYAPFRKKHPPAPAQQAPPPLPPPLPPPPVVEQAPPPPPPPPVQTVPIAPTPEKVRASCAEFPALNVEFDTDKAEIKPQSRPPIDEIAERMKASPQILLVEVRGHADERGSAAYNLRLTEQRAQAVRGYLLARGVTPERLQAKGVGITDPVYPPCKAHNETCWAKNRRVEFVVMKRADMCPVDEIKFELDSARIHRGSYPVLDSIFATVQGNPQIRLLEIQGHADERGSADHNLILTQERAHAVRQYLIDAGVDAGRLQAKGFGSAQPLCQEHDEPCWRRNRRVDFIIQDPTPPQMFPRKSDNP